MLKRSGSIRFWITASVLVGAWLLLNTASHGEAIVPRQPLHELPYTLGGWTGMEQPLEKQVVQAVGVSDYTNRVYFEPADAPLSLYVGYYASQRTGDTMHSPKNCLPGSGWDPIRSGYATIPVQGGHAIVVNEYVIQRDQDKQLVFYWYQGRGPGDRQRIFRQVLDDRGCDFPQSHGRLSGSTDHVHGRWGTASTLATW